MRIFLVLIFFCFPSFAYEDVSSTFVQKIYSKDEKINVFLNKLNLSNALAKKLFSEEATINKDIYFRKKPLEIGNSINKNNEFEIKKIKVSNQGFDDSKIFFSAKKVLINDDLKTLTAIGDVKFKLDEIELFSEKIIYSELINEIQAEGDVSLKDENGDFHNGENLIINNKTLNFQMTNIYAQLSDGSQMTARNVSSVNESIIIFCNFF